MQPPTDNTIGFFGFLSQSDTVGKFILLVLIVMSLTTWYLIYTKFVHIRRVKRQSQAFLHAFWNAPSIEAVANSDTFKPEVSPFANLTQQSLAAVEHHQKYGANRLSDSGKGDEFLTRAVRKVLDEETAKAESGLVILASIGSIAPFVGLFGTVWGIYHALVKIGQTGQGTLDKVAGPVGEALIMTAIGLAVAIPAVLTYNALTRSNRVLLSNLDSFAHDLFSFLTTGALIDADKLHPSNPHKVHHSDTASNTLEVA